MNEVHEDALSVKRHVRWVIVPLLDALGKKSSKASVEYRCIQVIFWLKWGGVRLSEFDVSPLALRRLTAYQLTGHLK